MVHPVHPLSDSVAEAISARWTSRAMWPRTSRPYPRAESGGHVTKGMQLIGPGSAWLPPHRQLRGERILQPINIESGARERSRGPSKVLSWEDAEHWRVESYRVHIKKKKKKRKRNHPEIKRRRGEIYRNNIFAARL